MAHEDRSTLEEIFERPAVGPLAGVVVADLSRVLAGPYCTMLLADLGALVIKVESPGGDDTRRWSPPRRGDDSTYYLSVNRNKYSIALDFKDPADLAVVRRIVDRADVVIQNFKPGGLEKFGLDAATLRQERPDLVYASISGFGTDGGANLPGYDLLVQALSGMMELTGSADGEPMRSGVAVFDVITGLHSALGILAALRVRDETGGVTTSRSISCRRRCPGSSTRPPRMSPAVSCRPGWVTSTPVCIRTSHCPPLTRRS